MDQEFIAEYIEKYQEETAALLKEKIVFRAQISHLSKKIAELEKQLAEKSEEVVKLKEKKKKVE